MSLVKFISRHLDKLQRSPPYFAIQSVLLGGGLLITSVRITILSSYAWSSSAKVSGALTLAYRLSVSATAGESPKVVMYFGCVFIKTLSSLRLHDTRRPHATGCASTKCDFEIC